MLQSHILNYVATSVIKETIISKDNRNMLEWINKAIGVGYVSNVAKTITKRKSTVSVISVLDVREAGRTVRKG